MCVHTSNEPQATPCRARLLPTRTHHCIQRAQMRIQLGKRQLGDSGRHERFHMHLLSFQLPTCGTRQDQQLAPYIFARQIDARIRLGITSRYCFAHAIGKRTTAVVAMKQPRQRSGQHAFDRMNVIAAATNARTQLNTGNPAPTVALSP